MTTWVDKLLEGWSDGSSAAELESLADVMARYPDPQQLWDAGDVDAGPAIAWLAGRLAPTPSVRRSVIAVLNRCLDAVRGRSERAPSWSFSQLCENFGPVFGGKRMQESARALEGFAAGSDALMHATELADDFGPSGRSFPDWARRAFDGASAAWLALAALEDDPRVSTGFEWMLRRELTLCAGARGLEVLRRDEEGRSNG